MPCSNWSLNLYFKQMNVPSVFLVRINETGNDNFTVENSLCLYTQQDSYHDDLFRYIRE